MRVDLDVVVACNKNVNTHTHHFFLENLQLGSGIDRIVLLLVEVVGGDRSK